MAAKKPRSRKKASTSKNPVSSKKTAAEKRTPFDGLLKHLADQFITDILHDLAGLDDIVSCDSIGGEIQIFHRLTDRVWRVTQVLRGQEIQFLFHLEFESSSVAHIARRLGTYGWGLYQKEKLPVLHLVWYVGSKRPSGWPDGIWRQQCSEDMIVGDDVSSTVHWWEVWLPGAYQAHDLLLEAPVYLMPFAPLLHGMKKSLLSELRDRIMEAGLSDEQQQDLLVILIFFASRKFRFLDIMEVFNMDILENNPFAEFLIQKGVDRGEKKGEKKGLRKGRKEGRKEGLILLLSSQAKKRFPHISEATLTLLNDLDFDDLQKLGEEILDLPDGRAFRQRLLELKRDSSSPT